VARRHKRTTEQSRALTGANVNRVPRRETITETQTTALDIETVKPEKNWTLNNGTYGTKQGDTDDPSTRNGTRRAYRHYGHLRPGGRCCPNISEGMCGGSYHRNDDSRGRENHGSHSVHQPPQCTPPG